MIMAHVLLRVTGIVLLAVTLVQIVGAVAAANQVAPSAVGQVTRPITPDDLKPPECASLVLTNLVVGSGNIVGTAANDLILGGAGADTLYGDQGTLSALSSDCVLGGSGSDSLNGDGAGALTGGDDVLLGGPGDDTLDGGPGSDSCYGNDDNDIFVACESRIQ